MYAESPSICVGDLEIKEDGTYLGWNICKRANHIDRVVESYLGTWVRISTYHYRANNDYDVILNKDGTVGLFGSSTTTNNNLVGHYEYGHMLKDVAVNHSELQ